MSDAPEDDGWWQASNGKWYPPEKHPDYVAPEGVEHDPRPQETMWASEPTPPDETARASEQLPPAETPWASEQLPPAESTDLGQQFPPSIEMPPPVAPEPGFVSTPPAPPPAPPAVQPLPGQSSAPLPPVGGGTSSGGSNRLRWAFVAVGVAVVGFVALGVIGVLLGGGVTADDLRVGSAQEFAPSEAFVSGVYTRDGVAYVAGTADDTTAVGTEVWASDVFNGSIGATPSIGAVDIPVGIGYLYDAIDIDTGGYLGTGEVYFPETGDSQPAVLRSDNGLQWGLALAPGVLGDSGIAYSLAEHDGQVLAITATFADELPTSGYWSSDDGAQSFRQLSPVGLEGVTAWGISATGDGFVLAGTDTTGETPSPAVARSSDGLTWERVEGDILGTLTADLFDIAAVDDGYIVVGTVYGLVSDDPLVAVSSGLDEWELFRPDQLVTADVDEDVYNVSAIDGGAVLIGNIDERVAAWTVTIDG